MYKKIIIKISWILEVEVGIRCSRIVALRIISIPLFLFLNLYVNQFYYYHLRDAVNFGLEN